MTEVQMAVFRCKTCGEMFVSNRSLQILMEHHMEKHQDRTKMEFVPL